MSKGIMNRRLFWLGIRSPVLLSLKAAVLAGILLFVPIGEAGALQMSADGRPVTNEVVIRHCVACHAQDADGRMGRISYLRKTPEGWQASIQRMMALYGVRYLDPEEAREIVWYLATYQGLAPEELEPGRFEVERRSVEFHYTDRTTENTCAACHSMGRTITQRRSPEEWDLLVHTHRYLYPLMDGQVLYGGQGTPPVERAIEHLSAAYPLHTPEWAAWEANLRSPRIGGEWTVTGHEPGHGAFFGTVAVREALENPNEFTTEIRYRYADSGREVVRTGRGLVYTGYQWRGRSSTSSGDELREVMMVDRGWTEMTGRWFTGDHDEFGVDITLRRISAGVALAGVYPVRVRAGAGPTEVALHGAGLTSQELTPDRVDLGPGISVLDVTVASPERAVVRVQVAEGATVGRRDLFVGRASIAGALTVYDQIDRISVSPTLGGARVGGIVVPKQFQPFEAIGWHNGPDGLPGTEDDLDLGPVEVQWSLEEYASTYDDDDVDYVGTIDARGLFTPAVDGPNPERSGNRNNIGTVWVVATYSGSEPARATPLTARSLLIVTAPLHMRWEGGVP